MKKLVMIIAIVSVFSFPLAGFSGFTTYTDRVAFEAALPLFKIDGFEAYAPVGNSGSGAIMGLNFYDFQVTTSPNALKVLNVPAPGGFNTTSGGSNYLYLDTDIGLQGSQSTFGMHTPTLAFGFGYGGVNEPGTIWDVTILGNVFHLAVNGSNDSADVKFWGAISDTPFSSILLYTSTDSGYTVDEVTYSAGAQSVPEPATIILLSSGLIGLAGYGRKRFS